MYGFILTHAPIQVPKEKIFLKFFKLRLTACFFLIFSNKN